MTLLTVEKAGLLSIRQSAHSPGTQQLFADVSATLVEVTRIGEFPIDGGGYADVWQGKRVSDGLMVAMKGLRLNREDQGLIKLLIREISIWSTLEHPNVLPFLGLSLQPGSRVPYLVSPWESFGNVMKYLEAHPDADRAKLIQGVADGLMYLHGKGVVHGDVKGANILVAADGHPVLADFGLSVLDAQNSEGQTTTQTFAGSARWMAPERLVPDQYGLRGSNSRTPSGDVFSFGMTIYEIYSGNLPFHEIGNMEASLAIIGGKRPARPGEEAVQRGLTEKLWLFVTRCWDEKPEARPNLSELARYLNVSLSVDDVAQGVARLQTGVTPPPAYTALPAKEHTFPVYEPCPFCDPDNEEGYVCPHPIPFLEDADEEERRPYQLGWIPEGHAECINCSRLAPIRKDVKEDRCAVCTAVFCENICGWCQGSRNGLTPNPLRQMEEWFLDEPAAEMLEALSPYLFFGNRYEQQKFRNYMFEKAWSFSELARAVMDSHPSKRFPRVKWQGPALGEDQREFGSEDWTCRRCALDLLEGNLFDWYIQQRQSDEELRLTSKLRPDCPRGRSCQDAVVDYHHSSRFNHICLPTISQPLQAPSDVKGEGPRCNMSTKDELKAFRSSFLPDQVAFRDRDGQPCFMVTVYVDDSVSYPAKATLWDWEWINNIHNRIKPHMDVYFTRNGSEYLFRGRFGLLHENESMEWVRCEKGQLPEGKTGVIGGRSPSGTTLYHAAVWWKGRRLPGQFDTTLGRAGVGYNGRDNRVCEGFDVLCWK